MMLNPSRLWRRRLPSLNHRRFSSSLVQVPLIIGILRESYNKWERRAPLCPAHVKDFLQKHPYNQVLVQPSSNRIFSNHQYQQAGAILVEDLGPADLVLGVKRPQSLDTLTPHKTHLFFSHVIKGQPENMPLLQNVLDKKIELVDYECIVQRGGESSNKEHHKPKRLVAFGKYAGMAGMMDIFQVLGRRLLLQNSWSTPFLNCPSAISHYNLEEVKRSVGMLGERLEADGLPPDLEPLIFAMTGMGGNVHSGVREIFDILPHETVSVEDLPQVLQQSGPQHKVYGVDLGVADLYQRSDDDVKNGLPFDREHFRENPTLYRSTFADNVAPYINVLVNGIYWDHRFPRLLTKDGMRALHEQGNERLLVVSDISCDVGGSIEFLDRSTTIDRPFFNYDPITGKETSEDIEEKGITVMGVDILPTELPVESSTHFGNAVSEVLEDFIQAMTADGIDVKKLSPQLANAYITTKEGKLSDNFKYLDSLMKHASKQIESVDKNNSMIIMLQGHLFDSGLINQVLDTLDMGNCAFEFKQCNVRHKAKDDVPIKSSVVLQVVCGKDTDLSNVESKIERLVKAIESAEATFRRIDRPGNGMSEKPSFRPATVETLEDKTVLLLGAGRVSKSVVDLLGRSEKRTIIVASDHENEAREIASYAKRARHSCFDIGNDQARLSRLIEEADVVISLLPVPMHPRIAQMCIQNGKDLVTASYESPDMRKLGESAKQAGIKILNEVGLDPGLDHMSAMRIMDDATDRGGIITKFVSVCGGLPSPEAAENPLKYKFSWSPRGVITASQNAARFRWEDRIVEIYGKELLQNASPFFDAWNDLHLECLPNRDSIEYEKIYGIENAKTIFRGTLRYRGFGSLMNVFQNAGMFESYPTGESTWDELLNTLRMRRGGFESLDDFLLACADDDNHVALRAKECLEWLGMTGTAPIPNADSLLDLFCKILEAKLQYGPDERDMVLMHHAIDAQFADGSIEHHQSSLQAFGDSSMSAMCKTVGYTTAAATDLMLSGALDGQTGLLLPTSKLIYKPILEAVEREGIVFSDTVTVHPSLVDQQHAVS